MKVKAAAGDTLSSLAMKYLGSASFLPSLSAMNKLNPADALTPGQEIDLGNFPNALSAPNRASYQLAQDYSRSLPINPTIVNGFLPEQNPYLVTLDPNFNKQVKDLSSSIFDPLERKAYDNANIPARISQASQASNILQDAADKNLLESSLFNRRNQYLGDVAQNQINDQTDTINQNFETQKSAYEQQQIQDYLRFLDYENQQQIASDYVADPNATKTPQQTLQDALNNYIATNSPAQITAQGTNFTNQMGNRTAVNGQLPKALPVTGSNGGIPIDQKFQQALFGTKAQGQGGYVTQGFGHTDFANTPAGKRIYGEAGHSGVDLVFKDYKIPAPISGTVITNRYSKDFGNMLEIQAADGTVHRIGHMASPSPLQVGQNVQAGQFAGIMGMTGNASAPHVHYDIKDSVGGALINPYDYVQGGTGGGQDSSKGSISAFPKFQKILQAAQNSPIAQQIYNYFAPKYGDEVAKKFVVVSNLESGWRPGAALVSGKYDNSHGIFQINLPAHNDAVAKYTGTTNLAVNAKWLQDPANSMKIADQIYQSSGFKPWTVARKAVKTASFGVLGNGLIDF